MVSYFVVEQSAEFVDTIMKERTLVLGSGVSALAYLFYNRDAFALAGEQVGGLFAKAKDLGPQYVWKTSSTTKLLTDMGYIDPVGKNSSAATRVIKIGYLWEGRVSRLEDLSASERAEIQRLYALKTRGIEPKASFMSDGKSEFEIYSVPVEELVAELLKRVSLRLVPRSAKSVNMYYKRVVDGSGEIWEYDKLVSTVPAPVLLKLIGKEAEVHRLKAFDKIYEKRAPVYTFENDMEGRGYAYIYVPGDDYAFHRVRHVGDGKVVREYTLVRGQEADVVDAGAVAQKRGQIVSGHEVGESLPSSVECYGRYASWQHGIRLEDVLEEIQ